MGRTSKADQKLMEAALDLVWEESYGSVTIDEICQRAGVKTGSFYYFYKSKADLAVAALEKLWAETWKPNLDRIFSPAVDPLVRLNEYFETLYEGQREAKQKYGKVLGCPVWSVGTEVSTSETDVCAVIRDILARKRRYLESAIRDAIAQGAMEPGEPEQLALALFALVEGLICQARITDNLEILRSVPSMAFGLLRVRKQVPATA